MERLFKLIKYNRDWLKYIFLRWGGTSGEQPLAFRLRNGQKIRIYRDGRFVLNEIYLDRVYDVPGVNIEQCSSVLDLGANVGVFAHFVASIAPRANVYCFEPAEKNYDILVRNVGENRLSNTQTYKLAISGAKGMTRLMTGGISVGYSIRSGSGPSELVSTVDMTEVFAMTRAERFDFVKMDVEGAELEILTSCTDQQLRRMSAISMEWHHSTDELQNMRDRLQAVGFETISEVVHGHVQFLKARLVK
jgi:FkbM family methyltransferase